MKRKLLKPIYECRCNRRLWVPVKLDHHGFRCAEAVAKKAAADAASAATVNPDAPNVLLAMMKLEQAKARAKTANKVALETEKERDAAETAVEELKRQLQPKKALTDDDAGDAHEMLANADNWDLRDHRQQATRVQNRRNVQVGSQDLTYKDLLTSTFTLASHERGVKTCCVPATYPECLLRQKFV